MSRIVFDIETVGRDFDSLDEATKAYFLRNKETEEEISAVKDSLSLYPVTAEIAAIGMMEPDSGRGAVYFQSGRELILPFEEEGFRFESGSEKDILEKFWASVKKYPKIVTFNGRSFDCPFILVRSAVNGVKPSKELMPNRYDDSHLDLMDRLSFYGASRRFSLDIWCRAFGIESPKAEVSGADVPELFRAGRFIDIARYCSGDVRATGRLLSYWEKYFCYRGGR